MPLGLVAAIETACLDAAGRAHGVSVSTLLGGAHVDRVEVAAYLFFRERSADGRRGGEGTPEALVARAEELVARYGFRVLKLKGGVLGPGEELRTLRLLRERFGDVPLRWDPNGAWSLATALRCAERLRVRGAGAGVPRGPRRRPGRDGRAAGACRRARWRPTCRSSRPSTWRRPCTSARSTSCSPIPTTGAGSPPTGG